MNFNGRNKGYESRGGHATAKKRKVNYNTEYDNCACGTKKFPTQLPQLRSQSRLWRSGGEGLAGEVRDMG
jgi:hypothetical protein